MKFIPLTFFHSLFPNWWAQQGCTDHRCPAGPKCHKITLKSLQLSVSCPIISKTTLLKKKLSKAHPNNQRTAAVAVARVSASLTGAEELAVRDVLLLTRGPDQQEVDLDKVQGLMKMVNIPVHSFTLLVGQYGHLEKCKQLVSRMVQCKLTGTSIGCQIGKV